MDIKHNPEFTVMEFYSAYEDYNDILKNQTVKIGQNINLQMKNSTMSKVTVNKNALTGLHTKMIVLENQACAPFITGLTAKDYSC